MQKLLILTASRDTLSWKSLPNKLAHIKSALNSGQGANFSIEIEYTPAVPTIRDERIAQEWLDSFITPYFNNGYDIVAFHFTKKQQTVWGVKPTLRGSNPNNLDEKEAVYFWADEDTLRVGFNQFEQTLLHEIAHSYFQQTKQKDITHEYHDEHKDITGLCSALDWNKYQPRRMNLKKQKNLLERIVGLLRTSLAANKPQGPDYIPKKELLPLVKRQSDKLVQEMEMLGLPIRITEGYRSPERQNELYAQGRTKPGKIVTNAKAGESLHNYGVAVDIVFRKQGYDATNDQWLAMASVAEGLGFEWGGKWNEFVDKPHLQMLKGHTLKDFQNKSVDYNKFK